MFLMTAATFQAHLKSLRFKLMLAMARSVPWLASPLLYVGYGKKYPITGYIPLS
jgi:hypothetical protein